MGSARCVGERPFNYVTNALYIYTRTWLQML